MALRVRHAGDDAMPASFNEDFQMNNRVRSRKGTLEAKTRLWISKELVRVPTVY
jgi:hypothetical protein